MRIRAQAFLKATLLLSLLAGPFIPIAFGGSTAAVSFGGTVNPPASGITLPGNVLQGDALSGSFSYTPGNSALSGSITLLILLLRQVLNSSF